MKKYFLVVFCVALLFVVAGCSKKNQVTCSATHTEDGITIKGEVVADLDKDNKITGATASYELNDETTAQQYCSLLKLMENTEKGVKVNCSGKKITIEGYANVDSEDENDKEIIGMTKEDFVKAMEEEEMTCK